MVLSFAARHSVSSTAHDMANRHPDANRHPEVRRICFSWLHAERTVKSRSFVPQDDGLLRHWVGWWCVVLLGLSCAGSAQAPKINVLFPNGGKGGTTVEVQLRGAALAGAEKRVVNGAGGVREADRGGAG